MWLLVIGRSHYHRKLAARLPLPLIWGLFQFKVMPFGLCNAPATSERLMDRVLQGLRWSRCLVYLDDIISFWTTFEDALDNLTLIFKRLHAYGLQLKSTKCHLFRTSVPFLGHIVGRRGLECDPKKIEDVKAWPIPDCLRSVWQFLGFLGYYRRFVPGFADLAEPLVALTGKDIPFVWRLACMTPFVSLRDTLVRAPVLAFPTETGPYILDTDASVAEEINKDTIFTGHGPSVGPFIIPPNQTLRHAFMLVIHTQYITSFLCMLILK